VFIGMLMAADACF